MIVILEEEDLNVVSSIGYSEVAYLDSSDFIFDVRNSIFESDLVGFFDKSKNKIQIIKNRYTGELGYTTKKKFLKIPKI